MSYIGWAVVAMLAYGVTAVFLKLALKDISPGVTLVTTNTILVLSGVALILYRGESFAAHFTVNRPMLFAVLAGLTLSLSIISYYIALSRGQTTVVVPIFASYFAVTTIIGFIFLGDDIKLTKILGVLMAGGAIFLLTR